MSEMQPPGDPTYSALNQLVLDGQLSPDQAQAAYTASQGVSGGAGPAITRGRQLLPFALRLDALLVGVGSSLLAAALVLSTLYTRMDGDLDWSNYLVGILSTLGLLGVATGAFLLIGDPVRKANLMGWPGALGAAGAGLMLGLALDDSDATLYVMGLAVLGISVGGHFLIRHPAFIVTAIAGLGILYLQIVDDLFGFDDLDGDNFGIWLGLALLVFTLAVTIGGWFLPTRDLSALLAGVGAVLALSSLMIGLMVIGFFAMAFGGMGMNTGTDPFSEPGSGPDNSVYHNDVWFLLVITVILVALWSACWWLRGHEGYRVLSLAALTTIIPPATIVLAVDSPSWWGAALALLGGAALVFATLRGLGVWSPREPFVGTRR